MIPFWEEKGRSASLSCKCWFLSVFSSKDSIYQSGVFWLAGAELLQALDTRASLIVITKESKELWAPKTSHITTEIDRQQGDVSVMDVTWLSGLWWSGAEQSCSLVSGVCEKDKSVVGGIPSGRIKLLGFMAPEQTYIQIPVGKPAAYLWESAPWILQALEF